MKKSLIALAVLASVAGAAQAEYTLYGIADVWLGRTSSTNAAGVDTNKTQMASGGLSGSRLGFKGSKDLGQGLTGVFKLEHGFELDTGKDKDAASNFNRQAFVGLAGGFGEVTFGNTWTAMDDVLGAANSGFDSALSASNNVLKVPGAYASNPGNTIKYTSPSIAGFGLGASHSMNEGDVTKAKVSDISLSYAVGALATNLAYQQQSKTSTAAEMKLTGFNASYDLGIVKLLGSVGQFKQLTAQSTDVQFGVDVPVGAKLTVSAGFASSKDKATATTAKVERSGFGVAAGYQLAETTTVYGGFRQAETKSSKVEDNTVAIGIKHTF
ncbi:MAG: hypothetical protein RJB34_1539 [Pseudomonadota bacterium]|jgi:predicted porin